MGSNKKTYEMIAERTGLQLDPETGWMRGDYKGYKVLLGPDRYYVMVGFSVKDASGNPAGEKTVSEALRACKGADRKKVSVTGYGLYCHIKAGFTERGGVDHIVNVLDFMTGWLHEHNYRNACSICGDEGALTGILKGFDVQLICDHCYQRTSAKERQIKAAEDEKAENVIGGIIGAFFGAALGVAVMILFWKLGYVAVVSGIVMGVASLKGYQMLSGKFTKRGVIICCLIMIPMIWLGHHLCWILEMMDIYEDVTFGMAVRLFREILEDMQRYEPRVFRYYYTGLGLQYLYTLAGIGASVFSTVRKKRNEKRFGKIDI